MLILLLTFGSSSKSLSESVSFVVILNVLNVGILFEDMTEDKSSLCAPTSSIISVSDLRMTLYFPGRVILPFLMTYTNSKQERNTDI